MTIVVPGMDLNCERVECQPTNGEKKIEKLLSDLSKENFMIFEGNMLHVHLCEHWL